MRWKIIDKFYALVEHKNWNIIILNFRRQFAHKMAKFGKKPQVISIHSFTELKNCEICEKYGYFISVFRNSNKYPSRDSKFLFFKAEYYSYRILLTYRGRLDFWNNKGWLSYNYCILGVCVVSKDWISVKCSKSDLECFLSSFLRVILVELSKMTFWGE